MPQPTGAKPEHRVVLIRHGETEWSKSGQHTSHTELPLTPAGERQAKLLPGLIGQLGLRGPLVIASPRRRATRTAELAGLAANHTWEALTEWDYGAYEGLTTEQIRARTPGWTVWNSPCPGGESAEVVSARADRVLSVVAAQLTERDVILVGHGHFSRALLARWAELPVAEGRRFPLSAGALSVLGFEHETRAILRHNVMGEP